MLATSLPAVGSVMHRQMNFLPCAPSPTQALSQHPPAGASPLRALITLAIAGLGSSSSSSSSLQLCSIRPRVHGTRQKAVTRDLVLEIVAPEVEHGRQACPAARLAHALHKTTPSSQKMASRSGHQIGASAAIWRFPTRPPRAPQKLASQKVAIGRIRESCKSINQDLATSPRNWQSAPSFPGWGSRLGHPEIGSPTTKPQSGAPIWMPISGSFGGLVEGVRRLRRCRANMRVLGCRQRQQASRACR